MSWHTWDKELVLPKNSNFFICELLLLQSAVLHTYPKKGAKKTTRAYVLGFNDKKHRLCMYLCMRAYTASL